MHAVAVLTLLFGFLGLMSLDGQVYTHAGMGVAFGGITLICAIGSLQKYRSQPSQRLVSVTLAVAGVILMFLSALQLPGAAHYQNEFNAHRARPKPELKIQQSTPKLTTIKYAMEPFRTFEIVGTKTRGVTDLESLTSALRSHHERYPTAEYEILAEVKCMPQEQVAILKAIAESGIRLKHYWVPVSDFGADTESGPYGLGVVDILKK
jgi:hypothetical protein